MKPTKGRKAVYGTAAATSSQPLATAAAIELLARGANAAEASVAVGAVLAVTEPCSNGLGGDLIALHAAADDSVTAILGNGASPSSLTYELYVQNVSRDSANMVTVPGVVDAWMTILERYSSGNVSREEVFSPAIRAARHGFPVGEATAYYWGLQEKFLSNVQHPHPLLIHDEQGARAPRKGELFVNKALAEVLEGIVKQGREAFYEGAVARGIVDCVSKRGGVMTLADLARHETIVTTALSVEYHGYTVYEPPAPTQGIVTLQSLRILDHLNYPSSSHSKSIHYMIEALRLSFKDAADNISDPKYETDNSGARLSDEYTKVLAAKIGDTKMDIDYRPLPGGGTVQFCVIDRDGNAMSSVQSNYQGFGTGISPANSGLTLQNRGLNFSTTRQHRNVVCGGKKCYHTIMPGLAVSGDSKIAFGVMGSFMQPQGHLQVLSGLIDEGLDAQQVVERGRFRVTGAFSRVEEGMGEDEVLVEGGGWEHLGRWGHRVRRVEESAAFGKGGVCVLRGGVVEAGCDGRGDGVAMSMV